MAQRILVPVDGSERSKDGLEYAIQQFPDAEITALHVRPLDSTGDLNTFSGMTEVLAESEEIEEATQEILDEAERIAEDHGVEIETTSVRGRADKAITEYAGEEAYDLVVIGSHGREGVTRVLLGSVAEKVVRRSPVPVLVVR